MIWPQGFKTFFQLNSTEYEIWTAYKDLNVDKINDHAYKC